MQFISRFGIWGFLALILLVNLVIAAAIAGMIVLEYAFQAFQATKLGQWLLLGLAMWSFLVAVALWVRRRAQSIFGIIILMIVVSILTVAAYIFWIFLPEYNRDVMLTRLREEPLNFAFRILILIQFSIIPVIIGITRRWDRFQNAIERAYTSRWQFVWAVVRMSYKSLVIVLIIWVVIALVLPILGVDLSQFDFSGII